MRSQYKGILLKLLLTLVVFGLCFVWSEKEVFLQEDYSQPAMILDAGHGGEDGGAVSCTGAKESTINLMITLRMEQILGLLGEAPMMLRNQDVSLHDPLAETLREKKVSDLKNRVEAVNANPKATLISIHQNSYPESKYRGTQVFYAPTGGSEELAEAIQAAVCDTLQKENTRQAKEIPETVYLMNHIGNRAILVECGFLTNPEEESMLRQPEYQCKLALVLSDAVIGEMH